jgi:hypothetical protein
MRLCNLIDQGIESEQKACTKDNKEQHSDSTCD